jgi:predicted nucleotidyltransferase
MRQKLQEELHELGVLIVYLFGSRANGTKTPLSDIDLGIVLRSPPTDDTRLLHQDLHRLFSDIYRKARIDIVFLQSASISLRYSAIREGKVLFEEDPVLRADFEQEVINGYLDFKSVLEYFDQVSAERYATV